MREREFKKKCKTTLLIMETFVYLFLYQSISKIYFIFIFSFFALSLCWGGLFHFYFVFFYFFALSLCWVGGGGLCFFSLVSDLQLSDTILVFSYVFIPNLVTAFQFSLLCDLHFSVVFVFPLSLTFHFHLVFAHSKFTFLFTLFFRCIFVFV